MISTCLVPPNALDKIKVGWNIGLCDYRYFPSYLGIFRNNINTELKYNGNYNINK